MPRRTGMHLIQHRFGPGPAAPVREFPLECGGFHNTGIMDVARLPFDAGSGTIKPSDSRYRYRVYPVPPSSSQTSHRLKRRIGSKSPPSTLPTPISCAGAKAGNGLHRRADRFAPKPQTKSENVCHIRSSSLIREINTQPAKIPGIPGHSFRQPIANEHEPNLFRTRPFRLRLRRNSLLLRG